MALTLTGLQYIADHKGKDFIADTINTEAPLLADKNFMPHKKKSGVEAIQTRPNAIYGGSISDGGTIPQNSSLTYTELLAKLVPFVTQVKVPIGLSSQMKGSQAVTDMVRECFDLGVKTLGYQAELQIYDKVVGTVTTGAAISMGAVTLTFDDVSRFRIGQRYVWNDNGTRKTDLFTVTAISENSDGVTGDVTFSTSASGTPAATADHFEPDDVNGSEMTSLWQLSSETTTDYVYTQTAAINGWNGSRLDASGAFTAGLLNQLLTKVGKKGRRPDRIAMHDECFRVHSDAMAGSSFRRFNDDELDPYGNFHDKRKFAGMRIGLSPTLPAVKVFAFNSKDVHLGVWNDIGPIGKENFRIAETTYNWLINVHAQMEVICKQRKSVGALHGITYT